MSPTASVRPALESDIPAIIALLLTSFRQFPLFAHIYSPLYADADTAHDTVWFWRRRLVRDLLNPCAAVVVAEVDGDLKPTAASCGKEADAVERESWRMLEWVQGPGGLDQASTVTRGKMVVGFAIWRVRPGHEENGGQGNQGVQASWVNRLRTSLLNLEGSFWATIYQRRDQDHARFLAYDGAEDVLSKQFYKEPCYYLDNLCVDFRYHRLGIGNVLLGWGLEVAREQGLPVGTEASPKGEGLYRKMGFEQVGIWTVPSGSAEVLDFQIPVMRLAAP